MSLNIGNNSDLAYYRDYESGGTVQSLLLNETGQCTDFVNLLNETLLFQGIAQSGGAFVEITPITTGEKPIIKSWSPGVSSMISTPVGSRDLIVFERTEQTLALLNAPRNGCLMYSRNHIVINTQLKRQGAMIKWRTLSNLPAMSITCFRSMSILVLSLFNILVPYSTTCRSQDSCTIRLRLLVKGIDESDIVESDLDFLSQPVDGVRYARDVTMYSVEPYKYESQLSERKEQAVTILVNDDSLTPRLFVAEPICRVEFVDRSDGTFNPVFYGAVENITPSFRGGRHYEITRSLPAPILITDLLPWQYPEKFTPPRKAYAITSHFAGISDENGMILIENVPLDMQIKFSFFHPDLSVSTKNQPEKIGIPERLDLTKIIDQQLPIDNRGRLIVETTSVPVVDLGDWDISLLVQAHLKDKLQIE